MAEVFLARTIAARGPGTASSIVKRVREHLADSDELRDMFAARPRFRDAARAPNIVRVLDVGETEDGLPFLDDGGLDGLPAVTPSRRGPGAARLIHRRVVRRRLRITAVFCAHVFPANPEGTCSASFIAIMSRPGVFLTDLDGAVKLLDFGIARRTAPPRPIGPVSARQGGHGARADGLDVDRADLSSR